MSDMDFEEQWGRLPRAEYAFPGPLRDRLVAAIAGGIKTSTSSLALEYSLTHDLLPTPGDREFVIDSRGRPVLVTQTTVVSVVRLTEVDIAHAMDEGEGFTTVDEWRAGHEKFWHSEEFRDSIGRPDFKVDDDTLVVCQRFEVIDRA